MLILHGSRAGAPPVTNNVAGTGLSTCFIISIENEAPEPGFKI